MYDSKNSGSVEKYSSAVSLSDMEVFIFPQLMYSLMLANIMSPRLWRWKNDPWFAKTPGQRELKRIQRLKQYIIDNFVFNLDLNTWGLTTKEKELARFSEFVNESVLSKSNALFGYEGDKYYFDMDIRRHFGLDKYNSNIIPYWKTETLEAMEAFRFKDGYHTGAGECVSFSALYASAAFAVADIPLEKIFLLATPLHSQNYLDIGDGIITNNRRIVTKNMWYNGTELSAKARRALENENVTIIAHNTGHVHTIYPSATIDKNSYEHLKDNLIRFCEFTPKMPDEKKDWLTSTKPITLDGVKSAEDARASLMEQRHESETADLAFMAFRDLSTSPWKPFLKAAVERNPVWLDGVGGLSVDDAYRCLTSPSFVNASIYDESSRLAQPDEVWNYGRGDGLEKAVALASVCINKHPGSGVSIDIGPNKVKLAYGKNEYLFGTNKKLAPPVNDDWLFQ
ncbi:MAG: hypothetical protein LBC70_00640 [Chitinispirillales bacterium]|jgi:hypothetical protein|nr:hypothetical protein [Chitinispirillales bacterium]